MRASDIMITKDRIVTARPDDSLVRAYLRMVRHEVGALPVVDDSGRLVGMITHRDVILSGFSRSLARLRVSEIMTRNVLTVSPDEDALSIAKLMVETGIQRIPVVDRDGKLLGLITQSSMIRLLVRVLEGDNASD